jgi:hypothetical protein
LIVCHEAAFHGSLPWQTILFIECHELTVVKKLCLAIPGKKVVGKRSCPYNTKGQLRLPSNEGVG